VNLLFFLTNSGQKSLTVLILSFLTTIQLIFKNKNREIKKIKVMPSVGFKPLGFEAMKHLRNRMRKENF